MRITAISGVPVAWQPAAPVPPQRRSARNASVSMRSAAPAMFWSPSGGAAPNTEHGVSSSTLQNSTCWPAPSTAVANCRAYAVTAPPVSGPTRTVRQTRPAAIVVSFGARKLQYCCVSSGCVKRPSSHACSPPPVPHSSTAPVCSPGPGLSQPSAGAGLPSGPAHDHTSYVAACAADANQSTTINSIPARHTTVRKIAGVRNSVTRSIGRARNSALGGLRRSGRHAQRAARRVLPAPDLPAHDLADPVRRGQPDFKRGARAQRAPEELGHARRAVGLERDRLALERAPLAAAALAADLERGDGRSVADTQEVQARARARPGPVVLDTCEDLARLVAARAVVVDAVAGDLAPAGPDGRVAVVAVGGRRDAVAVAVRRGRRRRGRPGRRRRRRGRRRRAADPMTRKARAVGTAEVVAEIGDRLAEIEGGVDRLVLVVALDDRVFVDVVAGRVERDHPDARVEAVLDRVLDPPARERLVGP